MTSADELKALPPRIAEPETSDASVLRATGKGWDDWFRLLDAWNGTSHTHAEIARYLAETFDISGWWAQGVTVGYERARGMRAVNERPDGFTVNASRTVPVGVDVLARAFEDEAVRAKWMPAATVRPRSSTPGKAWRGEGTGSSRVEARFTAKGPAKASVAIEHTRLESADEVTEWRAWWKARLDALQALLSDS